LYAFRVHEAGNIEPADGEFHPQGWVQSAAESKDAGLKESESLWGSSVQVRVEPGDKG
jgi:hypothetical protein